MYLSKRETHEILALSGNVPRLKVLLIAMVDSLLKDTINPYYCLLKNANFLSKKSNDQITSHIIKLPFYCCFEWQNLFFVLFCGNSLLMLKCLFRSFFRKQKGTKIFQWQEGINIVLISALSSTKACLSFLKFLFLAKIFRETFVMSLKST